MASHIRFAEGASIDKTPASFVRALENLVESLGLLENSAFIVRPQWHYNFKIFELRDYYEELLKNFLEDNQVNDIFHRFGDNKIYIISFPGFQRNNLQILTALGHEIGHPIARKYLDNESKDYKYDIEKAVQEKLADNWKGLSEDSRDKKKGELIDKIVSLRDGFIEEIMSDLVSCYIFNLSALIEMEKFTQSISNIDESDLDLENPHPAWRMRLRLTYKDLVNRDLSFLNRSRWGNTAEDILGKDIAIKIKSKLDKLYSIINETSDIEALENDPIAQIVYHYFEQGMPIARSWLNENYTKYILDRNLLDVIKCVKRLKEGIPPNVTNEKYIYSPKIQNVQNIMIAGCLYKETCIPPVDSDSGQEIVDQLDRLNQLMLKAIDLSQVHEYFHNFMEANDQTYKDKRILFRRFQ